MSDAAFSQIEPTVSLFELTADYGEKLGDSAPYVGEGYLPAADIEVGGLSTLGRRQNGLCTNWHYVGRAYMGAQAYRFACAADPSDDTKRRTEQMVLKKWYAGDDSEASSGVRYFSLAFKLFLPETPPLVTKGYVAQLHHGGSGPPPFALAWLYNEGQDAYFVHMGAYYDLVRADNQYDYVYTEVKAEGVDNDALLRIENGRWYRMLFAIDPGPAYSGSPNLSDRAPGDQGTIATWIMDPATGRWVETGEYAGRIGYWYAGTRFTTDHQPRENSNLDYQWKIGIYRNNADALTYYYDNISYADRWYRITHNYLTGYHRNVLSYAFDEGGGSAINDRSESWNTRRPVDYDNDGQIVGDVTWNANGVSGKSLKFNGSGYVRTPMDLTDFDFGNYQTSSVWFRTTAKPTTNKGLFTVDNYGDKWKVLVYLSKSLLAYGVRHPDSSYSKANYSFPDGTYADGQWHHAVGTFNRFAPDGKRVRLYIDGSEVLSVAGSDLPILRGNDFLSIGRFASNGYFVGDIDEVNIFNYAMTSGEVKDLYDRRGALP